MFYELLADGYYVAQRGYLALSMDITDADIACVLDAIAAFCDRHRDTR